MTNKQLNWAMLIFIVFIATAIRFIYVHSINEGMREQEVLQTIIDAQYDLFKRSYKTNKEMKR